jgi:glycosyltransferase involved in cell wall biosynthesis
MSEPAADLTVLIPALDEAESLPAVVESARRAARALAVSCEVLVVDGGSADGTAAKAEAAGARVLRQKAPGFGAALREGFAAARGRFILTMDGDGSHPCDAFAELWSRRARAGLIVASRYMPGGSAAMPPLKKALSRLLNLVSRLYLDLPVRDSSSGLRLYDAQALRRIAPTADDFAVEQEILVRLLAAGVPVEETPFRYVPRIGGKSKAAVFPLAGRYLRALFVLKRLRGGLASTWALAGVLGLGLLTGLWGLGWGLPGPHRYRSFPEALAGDAGTAQRLAESWNALYEGIRRAHENKDKEEPVTYLKGYREVAPGWTWPPDPLVNSLRSSLLQTIHPDEKKSFIILSQMRPWRLEFKPLYVQYGGAFIYPLGAFLKAASWAGAVVLVPDIRHYLAAPGDMARLYLCGRVFLLLFHLGSLVLLFDLGRRLSGWGAGLAGAGAFALAPVVVINTHVLKPHSYAAFFALLAARLLLSERSCRRRLLLCGAAAGAAAGANLSLAPLLGLPLLAVLDPAKRSSWKNAVLGCAAAVLVCLGLNPYLLFSYKDFAWETQVYAPAVFSAGLQRLPAMAATAAGGLGPILALLVLAAASAAVLRPGRRLLAVIFWGVSAALWLRFSGFAGDSGSLRLYYFPVALGCLLAADLLAAAPRALRLALLSAILADTGLRGAVYLENMRLDSTPLSARVRAADWIEANIPAGETVGLVRFPEPSHTPPFRYDRYRLVLFSSPDALPAGKEPRFIVVDEEGRSLIDIWAKNDYDSVAQFVPLRALWARLTDEASFVNGGMFVYRRRT